MIPMITIPSRKEKKNAKSNPAASTCTCRSAGDFFVTCAVCGDHNTPWMKTRLKKAIPSVSGANRSRLVRLDTIPCFVRDTEFITMFEAGCDHEAEPEADQGEAEDYVARRSVGMQPGHQEVPGGSVIPETMQSARGPVG